MTIMLLLPLMLLGQSPAAVRKIDTTDPKSVVAELAQVFRAFEDNGFEAFRKAAERTLVQLCACDEPTVAKTCELLDKMNNYEEGRNYALAGYTCDLWFILMYVPPRNRVRMSEEEFVKNRITTFPPDANLLSYDYPWTQIDGVWKLRRFSPLIEGGPPTATYVHNLFKGYRRRPRVVREQTIKH